MPFFGGTFLPKNLVFERDRPLFFSAQNLLKLKVCPSQVIPQPARRQTPPHLEGSAFGDKRGTDRANANTESRGGFTRGKPKLPRDRPSSYYYGLGTDLCERQTSVFGTLTLDGVLSLLGALFHVADGDGLSVHVRRPPEATGKNVENPFQEAVCDSRLTGDRAF